MRVLLLSNSYPPRVGGVETITQALARRLILRGFPVQVVTNRYPRALPSRETVDGVPVERLLFLRPRWGYWGRGRPDLWLAGLYYYPTTSRRLERIAAEFRPEVLNVHFPDAQIPFVLRLRDRLRCRLVVSLHGHEIERGFSTGGPPRTSRELIHLLREADAVTACSSYLLGQAKRLEPSISSKAVVIANGTDIRPPAKGGGSAHPKPKKFILAYGRLTRKKGFDLLLQAFAQVAQRYPAMNLLLAGDGEERRALEELCYDLRLGERVEFRGNQPQEELAALLETCSFVVMPSRQEPFGLAALEAMAAGKCVLATRVGGLPEFLDATINALVEPSVEALAEGLGRWLGDLDRVLRLGAQNRERAGDFTIDRMVERYLRVYQPR